MLKQKPGDAKAIIYALIFIGFVVLVFSTRDDTTTDAGNVSEIAATDSAPLQSTPDEIAAKEKELLYGQNCMSPWNGSHPAFVDIVKKQLNDPRSFEHIETTSWPRNDKGRSKIVMTFRAKNGFGGVITAKAVGTINGDDCQDAQFEFMDE